MDNFRRQSSAAFRRQRKFLFVVAPVCFVLLLVAMQLRAQQQEVGKRKDWGEFNLTLVGDNNIVTLATARQNYPKFMAAVAELRKGDAVFNNLETTFPEPDDYPGGALEVRIFFRILRF